MLVTTISSFSIFSPHSAIAPMSLTKPSIGSIASASTSRVVFALMSLEHDAAQSIVRGQ